MDPGEILESAGGILPEIAVGGAVVAVLLAELSPRWRRAVPLLALAALGAGGALAAAGMEVGGGRPIFRGALRADGWVSFFRLVFLGSSFLVGVFSIPALRGWASGRGEFFVMLLACTLGMLLAAGASDLLMVYLSLEFVGLSGYVMAGLRRRDRGGAEASLKYLLYGATASGFLIYGFSFLYGLTGTLQLGEIGRRLAELRVPVAMRLLAGMLVLTGFGFKVTAVPFHMWCPDVFEGAPTPVAAFLSVGPKAAGFAVLARFLGAVFPPGPAVAGGFDLRLVLALLSALTMAVGNLGALHQQNLKRLLAYSTIGHAGYVLLALAIFTPDALAALLFYMAVYAVMNLGAFLAVLVLEDRHGVRTVAECRGLGWRAPVLCGLATVFLFSLTGIPPTAGFAGKLLVFSAAIRHGLEGEGGAGASLAIPLVGVAVVFTVVSLFYYARILAAMFLSGPCEGAGEAVSPGTAYGAVLWLLAAGTVGLGLFWDPLDRLARAAAVSLFAGSRPPVPG